MKISRHVIIGLPASGKTTYLAALWHLIEAGEATVDLELLRATGDLTHLNEIAEAWRSFRPIERTSQTGDIDVSMQVRSRDGAEADLLFPDLAGESFDMEVEGRLVSAKYVGDHSGSDGILLFISANQKIDLALAKLNAMFGGEGEGEGEGDKAAPPVEEENPAEDVGTAGAEDAPPDGANATETEDPVGETGIEWAPNLTQHSVRIVQVLQDLLDHPFEHRPRRLAIIVSAWDLVTAPRPEPSAWLAETLPLVEQFLASNADMFEARVYGVSAQGAPLDKKRPATFANLPASERIIVQGHGAGPHDLTAPLTWLMTGD